jgi:hypothetical protein
MVEFFTAILRDVEILGQDKFSTGSGKQICANQIFHRITAKIGIRSFQHFESGPGGMARPGTSLQ